MRPILISACLLGISCRYDGQSKRNEKVLQHLASQKLIPVPVCPEQLAGLPTPRKETCFAEGDGAAVLDGDGRAVAVDGTEMNEVFLKGAIETMKVARLAGCKEALLKERSPSCGVHKVYLGKEIRPGQGITCALLQRNGLKVQSEEDL